MIRRVLLFTALCPAFAQAQSAACDKACLQGLANQYRAAYVAHKPAQIPVASKVRYTENFAEMPFPEGTWDTVTKELGPALTLTDPVTGNIAIYTATLQNDIPGLLAIRLHVQNQRIDEIEHIISTKRFLSGPPTPIGDPLTYEHDPVINEVVPMDKRLPREKLFTHGHGYFNTLQKNTGEIRGTCFMPGAIRRENGQLNTDIEAGFKSGRYRYNERVRRWPVMVDEEKGVAVMRGFIDHKGVLDEYKLTDGTPQRSNYHEPQSWGFLEMFKIKNDCIASVVATFIQTPYYLGSPWNPNGN